MALRTEVWLIDCAAMTCYCCSTPLQGIHLSGDAGRAALDRWLRLYFLVWQNTNAMVLTPANCAVRMGGQVTPMPSNENGRSTR